jgi:hypothetical protein
MCPHGPRDLVIAYDTKMGPKRACNSAIFRGQPSAGLTEPSAPPAGPRRQLCGPGIARKTDTSVRAAHATHAAPTTAVALAVHKAAICLVWDCVEQNWRPSVAFSMYEGRPMPWPARPRACLAKLL